MYTHRVMKLVKLISALSYKLVGGKNDPLQLNRLSRINKGGSLPTDTTQGIKPGTPKDVINTTCHTNSNLLSHQLQSCQTTSRSLTAVM